MSSNIYWRPTMSGQKLLAKELKFALKNNPRYDALDRVLTDYDIPYFEGLRDAGIKDAQKVIDAIEKHGEIEINEKF